MESAITIGCNEKGNVELSLWRVINFNKDGEEWKLIIKTRNYHDILRMKETLNLKIEQITLQDNENEFSLVPIGDIKDAPNLWTGSNNNSSKFYVEQTDNGDYKVVDEYGAFHIVSKEDFTLTNEC